MSWIDDYVAEIDDLLADFDRIEADALIDRMRPRFHEEGVRLKFKARTFGMRVSVGDYCYDPPPSDDDYIADLNGFRARLLEVKAEREDPYSVHYQQPMSVSEQVDVMNHISVIQSLPDSTLSEEDKMMLSGMLTAIQNLEGDKKKAKVMEVVRWLGDKAVDVAIAAIPALASMI